MTDFKPGDRVVFVGQSKAINIGEVHTIKHIGPWIRLEALSGFEFASCELMHERDFVRMCIEQLLDRDISIINKWGGCSFAKFYKNRKEYSNIDDLLSFIYPTETPEQKELRELEEQQRNIAKEQDRIAERMKELREGME